MTYSTPQGPDIIPDAKGEASMPPAATARHKARTGKPTKRVYLWCRRPFRRYQVPPVSPIPSAARFADTKCRPFRRYQVPTPMRCPPHNSTLRDAYCTIISMGTLLPAYCTIISMGSWAHCYMYCNTQDIYTFGIYSVNNNECIALGAIPPRQTRSRKLVDGQLRDGCFCKQTLVPRVRP